LTWTCIMIKSPQVGNAGHMTADRKYGEYIDRHDVVVRFNVLPVKGFEQYVGSKTTLRVVNHRRSVTACCRRGWPEPRDSNGTDTTAGIMLWFPNQVRV
jgi:hypothetical protein